MLRRIRVIALVGAGAITSAGICSLYLAYTLEDPTSGSFPVSEPSPETATASDADDEQEPDPSAEAENNRLETAVGKQSFLVAFSADSDPQVRTLAAWGAMSAEEERQTEILEFVRQEKDPEVRVALYRYLQGQRSISCSTLLELVKNETDQRTRLVGCDLLAGAVKNGATPKTVEYFNREIVPELKESAVNGEDRQARMTAIIALRRAGTPSAIEALQDIIQTAADVQVVKAASSAMGLAATAER